MSDMQGITLHYFYDWLNYDSFGVYFRIINPEVICKGNSKYILCETLIDNDLGINKIRIYDRGIVAFSVDGKEVLYGEKVIIALENGKVKFVIKVYSSQRRKRKALSNNSLFH